MSVGRVLLVEEGGVGGVADYTCELAGALTQTGWDVEVATALDHAYSRSPGLRIHALFPYVRGRTRFTRAVRGMHLSKAVNGITHGAANVPLLRIARRCDVVHVQGGEWPPLGALQALLVRAAGRPLVWTPHNTFDRGVSSYVRSRMVIDACAAGIVLHSEYDRAQLSPQARAKATVIPHGEYGSAARRRAPAADAAISRAGIGATEEELVVLLFGQLRPDKGVRDLLEAAAGVEGVHIVLAGEDKGALAESRALLADARLQGRTSVLNRFLSVEQAVGLFAAADVAALPYHRVSASGVLALAYGLGCPVVAYPVGGLTEYVVDGQTGWLCVRAEPAALAAQLREIVAAGRDACRERGARARHLANERFSWQSIAQQTAFLYEKLRVR